MMRCAILEQAEIASRDSARCAISKDDLILFSKYQDKVGFRQSLHDCIAELLRSRDDEWKLLVISDHGKPWTGTYLEGDGTDDINLQEFSSYFKVLPKQLVVLVSACFGIYPTAALAIQRAGGCAPFVAGPLVNISVSHANEFQAQLVELLKRDKLSRLTLFGLIRKFNSISYRSQYSDRLLFGMYDQIGNFFPRRVIGVQLAAPTHGPKVFSVVELSQPNTQGSVTSCLIQSRDGTYMRTNIDQLVGLVQDVSALIGISFIASYQVLRPGREAIAQVYLCKVRKGRAN